ncbi:hypothetical protein Natoc_3572 [Natronococcus occultus SP4]|uniref:Uncharacterized protein n=1 Tax=Natronococcus occultus SP4 TaxID=694430 RepID=L0K2T1_9EURY|nr:hypothetical protein Natoc_3572 [Natronococcus occultus SP4]
MNIETTQHNNTIRNGCMINFSGAMSHFARRTSFLPPLLPNLLTND